MRHEVVMHPAIQLLQGCYLDLFAAQVKVFAVARDALHKILPFCVSMKQNVPIPLTASILYIISGKNTKFKINRSLTSIIIIVHYMYLMFFICKSIKTSNTSSSLL